MHYYTIDLRSCFSVSEETFAENYFLIEMCHSYLIRFVLYAVIQFCHIPMTGIAGHTFFSDAMHLFTFAVGVVYLLCHVEIMPLSAHD